MIATQFSVSFARSRLRSVQPTCTQMNDESASENGICGLLYQWSLVVVVWRNEPQKLSLGCRKECSLADHRECSARERQRLETHNDADQLQPVHP